MRNIHILLLVTLLSTRANAQIPEKLLCEYERTPMGLETGTPRLSWQMKASNRGAKQTAYQILVADNEADIKKDKGNIWDSQMVKSEQSVKIDYAGKSMGGVPLESRKRYFWKVRIWDEKNKPSSYSEPSWWEMALLKKEDWAAHWIGKNATEGKSIELQKEFNLDKRATRVRIYVTGLGAYHLIFNGKKIGQDILTPGFTNRSKTLPYQIYEVSNEDLSIGINFITATLGNAWQKENLPCCLLFQMEIEFYDGSRQTIISDESWKTRLSPIIFNDIHGGEVYDALLEYGKDWENAIVIDNVFGASMELKPQITLQAKIIKEIKAKKITAPKKGRYVFDFGEQLIGFAALQIEGKAGKVIEMKYAENLTEKGLVDQKAVKAIDKYILKGYGIEKWEPKFTYHGFRFVEIEGLSEKPDENTLVAKVLYENTPFVENFAYSAAFLDKIYPKKMIIEPNLSEKKIVICPILATESKIIDTNYGKIISQSALQGNKFILKLSLPANTSAQIQLPLQTGKTINHIKESGKSFIVKKKPIKIEGVTYVKSEKDKAIFEVSSGNYEFVVE